MVSSSQIEEALHRLYIAVPGTTLRKEDRKKVVEIAGILTEIDRIVGATAKGRDVGIVDAAAGKAYVGLLAAELVLAAKARPGHIALIERDGSRAAACRLAAAALRAPGVDITVLEADVGDPTAWPVEPDLVVALHACGPAADSIIRQAVTCRARHLLLVPCCTSRHVAAADRAARRAEELGLPRHAEVRRRFIQALVDGERTLVLEAAGYETEVVPFVPPTVTPHNLLWRSRRVGEPRRMAAAAADLARLRHTDR
jgi:hypothetical protein